MSTKKQTNTVQTNTYDPSSMNAFHDYTNQVSDFTKNWMGADPTKTPGFNLMYQAGLNNANTLAGRNIRNLSSNALSLGMNPNSAAFSSQLMRANRAGSGLQANAFMNTMNTAQNQQNFAAQLAASYRPLQTGGKTNSTETTGGLGSWLPQVAGMGLSAAMPFMSSAGKAMPSSAGSSGSGGGALPGGGFGAGIGYTGDSYWGRS